jgi:hypothetical protein
MPEFRSGDEKRERDGNTCVRSEFFLREKNERKKRGGLFFASGVGVNVDFSFAGRFYIQRAH